MRDPRSTGWAAARTFWELPLLHSCLRVWEARVFRGRASGHHVRAGADPHVAEERCRAPLERMLRLWALCAKSVKCPSERVQSVVQ